MDVNELKKSITDLLWRGKPSEAAKLLQEKADAIEAEIKSLSDKVQDLKEQRIVIQELAPSRSISVMNDAPESVTRAIAHRRNIRINKSARNKKVLEVARRLQAKSKRNLVKTHDLKNLVKQEGIDMGVADNRIATALSNILLRTGGFEKVDDGVYRAPESEKPDADTSGPSLFNPRVEAHNNGGHNG